MGWINDLWHQLIGLNKSEVQSAQLGANLSLRNQQILNEEEFQRKMDFYEQYESPQARVNQFKNAGLNPMMLANGGASVSASGGVGSAGSAPASAPPVSSGGAAGLLDLLMNYKLKSRELDIEDKAVMLREQENPSKIFRNFGSGEASFAKADEIRLLADKKASQLTAQTDVMRQELENKKVEKRLAEANISKAQAEAALKVREEALLSLQEDKAKQYWENVVELQELQKDMARAKTAKDWAEVGRIDAEVKLLGTQNDNLVKEGVGIVLNNGKLAHEFDILGKEAANTDKRIRQENAARVVGMVTDCVGAAAGVASAAAGGVSAAAAVRTAGASMMRANSYKRQTDYNVNRPYYRGY